MIEQNRELRREEGAGIHRQGREKLSIVFTGDVSFTGGFAAADWTCERVAQDVISFLHSADHVVANLEGPLSSRPPRSEESRIRLASPLHREHQLERLGVNVLNLSNNHSLDAGEEGLAETLAVSRRHGWLTHGVVRAGARAQQPLMLGKGETTVALLAFSEFEGGAGPATGFSPARLPSRPALTELLSRARDQARYVVVQYHGGAEYIRVPAPPQRRLAERLARLGADLVIIHHAHVVQPVEEIGSTLVFHGLGNFVFDIAPHRSQRGTTDSLLVRATFCASGMKCEWMGTRIDRDTLSIGPWVAGETPGVIDPRTYWQEYCRAVFEARFWPDVQRDEHGLPCSGGGDGPARRPLKQLPRLSTVVDMISSLSHDTRRYENLALIEHLLRLQVRKMRSRVSRLP